MAVDYMTLDLPCTATVSDTGTWDARAARRLRVGRVPRVFPKSGYEQEIMSQNEVAKCDVTTNMIETFPLKPIRATQARGAYVRRVQGMRARCLIYHVHHIRKAKTNV